MDGPMGRQRKGKKVGSCEERSAIFSEAEIREILCWNQSCCHIIIRYLSSLSILEVKARKLSDLS